MHDLSATQLSLKVCKYLTSSAKSGYQTLDHSPIARFHYARLFVPLRESVPYWEGGSKQRRPNSDTKTCYAGHWGRAKRKPATTTTDEIEKTTERKEGREWYTANRSWEAIATDQQDTKISIWGSERKSVCVLPSVHELRNSILDRLW